MAEVQLPAGRLQYERTGAGPDVVLLHGLLGSVAQWQGAMEGLAAQATCWALELPGISRSQAVADASLPGLRGWLEQALGALGLQRFSLIGSSWGGALALEFATASPERGRLQKLVLAAPAHPYWTPSRRQRWLLTPPITQAAAWVGARLSEAQHRALLAQMYGDPGRLQPESVRRYHAAFQLPGLGQAVAAYARRWREDQRRLAAALTLAPPALLVWGGRDAVVPVRTAAALVAALPHAELRVLAGLGHIPFAEAPERFNAAVLPFLCG